jgi:hypothetical protein
MSWSQSVGILIWIWDVTWYLTLNSSLFCNFLQRMYNSATLFAMPFTLTDASLTFNKEKAFFFLSVIEFLKPINLFVVHIAVLPDLLPWKAPAFRNILQKFFGPQLYRPVFSFRTEMRLCHKTLCSRSGWDCCEILLRVCLPFCPGVLFS